MASPRSGWRGTITLSSAGNIAASVRWVSSRISSSPGWVEAATMTGRPRVAEHQALQLGRVGGRRRNVELQISGGHDIAAAERGKALGIDMRLRQADLEAAQQRRDRAADAAPARKRAMRHPAVDQHHRQPPRRARQDEIGPQVGLDEQRQTRPPVIEKARDIARRIVGHVLMDDIGGKPLGDDRRRRHRAGSQQNADVQRAQPFDQGRRGQHFADAGAMDPDQRSVRPDVRRSTPRRSPMRAGSSLPCFSRRLISAGASGTAAADSFR